MNDKDTEIPMWMTLMIIVILILMILSGISGGCSHLNKKLGLKDDNLFEEIMEERIKNQTGLDMDLTPESSER